MEEIYQRTELLIGEDGIRKLRNASVLVVGLGGVGAYCCENLSRAGIGKMTLVDGDIINPSNFNRQLIATRTNLGKLKAEVLAKRIEDINPKIQLNIISSYIKEDEMQGLLKKDKFNFVVDAIDTLSPKVSLIYNCVQLSIPIASSMGSGGRVDPQKVKIDDISRSFNCPLAFKVRKLLHRKGVFSGVSVVYSSEKVDKLSVIKEEGQNKKSTVGTISYMPAIFGCFLSSIVIRELIK
ncbi:MAG: tRNA threonylcarbamoyladenosine dehydratase [Bacteroidales bacterium]|jgi:tRNA A37 threonylcarbamoyladenosine dehydratase|nr:tRNA threonylcarbamoyladenosine dehydratase [Bacteroidales bacterium]